MSGGGAGWCGDKARSLPIVERFLTTAEDRPPQTVRGRSACKAVTSAVAMPGDRGLCFGWPLDGVSMADPGAAQVPRRERMAQRRQAATVPPSMDADVSANSSISAGVKRMRRPAPNSSA